MVERWLVGLVEYSFVVLVLLKSSQEAQSAQQLGSSALKNEYSYTQLLRQLWNQCRGSSQQLRGATTSFFSALLLLLPQLKRLRLKLWIAVSRSFATFFKVFWSCSSSASPTWSCRCCCRSTRPRPSTTLLLLQSCCKLLQLPSRCASTNTFPAPKAELPNSIDYCVTSGISG